MHRARPSIGTPDRGSLSGDRRNTATRYSRFPVSWCTGDLHLSYQTSKTHYSRTGAHFSPVSSEGTAIGLLTVKCHCYWSGSETQSPWWLRSESLKIKWYSAVEQIDLHLVFLLRFSLLNAVLPVRYPLEFKVKNLKDIINYTNFLPC